MVQQKHIRGEWFSWHASQLISQGKYQQAISELDQLAQLTTEKGNVFILRAMAENGLGNYQDALNDAYQARHLGINGPLLDCVMGHAHVLMRNYKQGIGHCEQYVKSNPETVAGVLLEIGC